MHRTPVRHAALALGVGLLVLTPAALADTPRFARAEGVKTIMAGDGFEQPLYLCSAPGDARLFVVEQPGRIRWIEDGRPSKESFLDLTDRVSAGGERGLLGLAFHPGYARNGRLYVNYTDRNGDTQVERFTVRADRRTADPATAKHILTVDQPFANHNGGMVTFGPDGMLYVGMGDGGAGAIPWGTARTGSRCSGRSCGSTWTTATRMRSPTATRTRSFHKSAAARSGRWACATRGGSRSTVAPTA
jgi:glucose/arabinose dehydrogenase